MPRLEHLGVAVRDAAAAVALYERLFGYTPYKRERVDEQGVETIFLGAGGAKVELLEATRPDSPIAGFIEKRGPGLHHLAFEVRDIRATMQRLRDHGFRLLNDEPKRGADEKLIVFVHPKDTGGVLVEFCQRSPEPLVPSYAPFRDGRLAYYLDGQADGPSLVLLHAALGSTELETRRLLPTFNQHFKTIAVDFAAHGQSDAFDGQELTLDFFSEAVPAVLDHLGLDRAHLFGFSMGGSSALHAARNHADRVDRLVVHGMNVQWDQGEVEVMTDAMAGALGGDVPHWADRLAETHGPDRWQDLVRRMVIFTEALPDHYFANEDLAQITAPTLVSAGDADRYFRIEHALNLWRTLPNARLAVHPRPRPPDPGCRPRALRWACDRLSAGPIKLDLMVRPLNPSDVPHAAALAADAFHTDPLFTHLYPDPVRRRHGLRMEFAAYLRRIYLPIGIVETVGDLDGIALWTPPGAGNALGWREKLLIPMLLRAVGWRRFWIALRDYHAFNAAFPNDPVLYLGLLAVAPEAQGQGVGSALLQAGLNRADRHGWPVYLETGTEGNVGFYERHGFHVTRTVALPYGPDHWAMRRDPA